jgi:hypothetical protein
MCDHWVQLNTRRLPESIAYEYVLGNESLVTFRSATELNSRYPEASVDDDDDDASDATHRKVVN